MTKLTTKPNEGSTYIITVNFKDFDDVAFTPITCVWSLSDTAGTIQNARSRVTATVTGSSHNFVLSGDDLVYDDATKGARIFLVEGTYTGSYGTALPFREEAKFTIANTTIDAE